MPQTQGLRVLLRTAVAHTTPSCGRTTGKTRQTGIKNCRSGFSRLVTSLSNVG